MEGQGDPVASLFKADPRGVAPPTLSAPYFKGVKKGEESYLQGVMKGEFLTLGDEQASVVITFNAFEGGVETELASESWEYLAGVMKGEFLKGVTTRRGFLDGDGTPWSALLGVHSAEAAAEAGSGDFAAVGGVYDCCWYLHGVKKGEYLDGVSSLKGRLVFWRVFGNKLCFVCRKSFWVFMILNHRDLILSFFLTDNYFFEN